MGELIAAQLFLMAYFIGFDSTDNGGTLQLNPSGG